MKFKILPIAGDASIRKFYRVIFSNKKSKIIVTAKKEKYKNLVAYTAINNFLIKNKILAPKLYSYDFKKGIIVIEDFGISYHSILSKKKNKFSIYTKFVDLLLRIQKIIPKTKIKSVVDKPHMINKYSIKHLHKESDLFFDWYLPLFLSNKKSLKIKSKAKIILSKLYKKINFSNSYFVHRDFHSQNLMKMGAKIGVIDSQDAIIGNPAYDLASLIDDVRIKTSKRLKKQVYKYYVKNNLKIYKNYEEKFLEDFNILSIQRSLKIIGIFSRLFARDNKSQYLKFIPYTWKLLEMRIDSKIFKELRQILDKNVSKKLRKKYSYK